MQLNENLNKLIEDVPSQVAAGASVAIGSGGTLVQVITDYANLFVACGNAVLVAAGLYVLYKKIVCKRKDKDDKTC